MRAINSLAIARFLKHRSRLLLHGCLLAGLALGFSGALWAQASDTGSESQAMADPVRLLVFGDSLSAAYGIEEQQGWVRLLQNRFDELALDVEVINSSVSGETSSGGLARLPAVLDSYQPDVVFLELGGNDGLRGLPLAVLKQNLQRMIDLSQDAGAEVVLTGIQIPPNYGPRYTIPFAELFGDLAEENGLAFVPFLIDGIPQQPELMQGDGIHPRAEAQWMIVDNVWPVLEPAVSALLAP